MLHLGESIDIITSLKYPKIPKVNPISNKIAFLLSLCLQLRYQNPISNTSLLSLARNFERMFNLAEYSNIITSLKISRNSRGVSHHQYVDLIMLSKANIFMLINKSFQHTIMPLHNTYLGAPSFPLRLSRKTSFILSREWLKVNLFHFF